MYKEWMEAYARLQQAKADELELRNAICERWASEKLEGSKTVNDGGFKITVTKKLNRTIDTKALATIFEDLSDEEKEAIDFKPSLKLKQFKELDGKGKLAEVVTIKPAQSSLSIKPVNPV